LFKRKGRKGISRKGRKGISRKGRKGVSRKGRKEKAKKKSFELQFLLRVSSGVPASPGLLPSEERKVAGSTPKAVKAFSALF
jgi:hypothetical protein